MRDAPGCEEVEYPVSMKLLKAMLLAAAVLLAACAQQRPGTAASAGERLAERQDEFFAAHTERDADRVAAVFAELAVLHAANMPPVEGREAIRRFYGNVFRFLVGTRAAPLGLEVAASADLAYSYGGLTNAFSGPDSVQEFAGKYTLVWRWIDGDWQIVLYSVSSDAR